MKQMVVQAGFGVLLLTVMLVVAAPVAASESELGKKVFAEKRCAMCHAIGGEGGKIGPDLSDVGSRRDGDWLRTFLKDPKGTVPKAKMLPIKATDEELASLVDYLLTLQQ